MKLAIGNRYYGLRDFTVVSPDGIGLRFASKLGKKAAELILGNASRSPQVAAFLAMCGLLSWIVSQSKVVRPGDMRFRFAFGAADHQGRR